MSTKKNKGKISIKNLQKKYEELKDSDVENKLSIVRKILNDYPKNIIGYNYYISLVTNDYQKYINDEELKELKQIYELGCNNLNKSEKEKLKLEYEEYIYDLKEVDNLKKIKKDIVSKLLIKKINENSILLINQYLNELKLYDKNGFKIRSLYDLINGVFLLSCMIYNIIFSNILLIITIPFGIFGIINIYSFFDNFIKRINKKRDYESSEVYNNQKEKLKELKNSVKKTEEVLDFLITSKKDSLLKIPQQFLIELNDLKSDNEYEIANTIYISLKENNMALFNSLLEANTNLKIDDISEKISIFSDNKENIIEDKKSINNKFIYMKSINNKIYLLLIIMLLLSIGSIIVICKNFYELNFISFLIAIIVGVLKLFIYNIETGKHASVYETFSDCLVSVIFSSTLSYDLIYSSINNSVSFEYCFLQMPLLFLFIFIGFVLLGAIFKYKNLLKKINK